MTGEKVLPRLGVTATLLLSGLLVPAFCGPGTKDEGSDADGLFSSNYGEARGKFLEASRAAGAAVESYRNPHAGPRGELLAIDIARLGPKDAGSFLVVISGTHGVEGFAGSALQTGLLREVIAARLEPGTALLMIPALNPCGFAHLRRFNEDNIDLNRNFVDHSLPYRENPGYDQLREALDPVSLSPLTSLRSFLTLARYRLRHGKTALKEAVNLGQYTHRRALLRGAYRDLVEPDAAGDHRALPLRGGAGGGDRRNSGSTEGLRLGGIRVAAVLDRAPGNRCNGEAP